MNLEEHRLEDNLAKRCEVCGTELRESEIEAGRESGGPFLCAVHADEELAAASDEPEAGEDAEA